MTLFVLVFFLSDLSCDDCDSLNSQQLCVRELLCEWDYGNSECVNNVCSLLDLSDCQSSRNPHCFIENELCIWNHCYNIGAIANNITTCPVGCFFDDSLHQCVTDVCHKYTIYTTDNRTIVTCDMTSNTPKECGVVNSELFGYICAIKDTNTVLLKVGG